MSVIEAVGIAVASNNEKHKERVSNAMRDAILKAIAEGISDAEEQRQLIIAARDKVLER